MNEAPDPLEAELSALRPQAVSGGLRRRIAGRLADPPAARRRTWRIALATGLAAACLAAIFLRWDGGRGVESIPDPGPDPVLVAKPSTPPPVAIDAPEPTLVAYERTLARSPEDLIALLDRGARAAPGSRADLAPIGAFTRPDAILGTPSGAD